MGRDLSEPSLFVPDAPAEADRAVILAGLAAYNRDHADVGATGPLAVLLRDVSGATVGGLWGTTLFRWLHIELVFVPPEMRGAAIGTAMLCRAEELAVERGCTGACLDTYSFQARGFYERLGYGLAGTIDDCPPGEARYFMWKQLVPRLGFASVR